MHIGFLTPEYPHSKTSHSAGIGTSIKSLGIALVKKGVSVSVFVYSQNSNDSFSDENLNVYKIERKKYITLGWYFHRKYINKYVQEIISKNNISLIEVPDWTGISAFMKFSCPIVIKIHGSDTYFCHLEKRKQKKKNFLFENKAMHSADKVVAVSQFSANVSKELFKLKGTIVVLPNSVNTNFFTPNTNKKNSRTELLYFGSVIRKKGVLELASIFNLVVENNVKVKLKIIGRDIVDVREQKSTLALFYEKLSEKAKSRVDYLNHVAYEAIPDHIANATAVVLPSFAEALPMTWLEVMSSGKLLIASDIGWSNEIIEHGVNGYSMSPLNHEEFSDKICEVINNSDTIHTLEQKARETIIRNFSEEVVVKKHIEFYSKVINDGL